MFPLKVRSASTTTREASIWGIIFQEKKLPKMSPTGKKGAFHSGKKHHLKSSTSFHLQEVPLIYKLPTNYR